MSVLVILLLDEPTWDLDPLNTYLVISILSNAAKKYGTTIILTMEKPRSGKQKLIYHFNNVIS